MEKDMFKKILSWFLVNAFLPIVSPVLFLAIVAWFSEGTFPIVDLFFNLIDNGFYIFSAATLIFSLYEEYSICEKCIGIVMQTCLVLMLIVTLGMFYMIHKETVYYVNQHHTQFYLTWLMTAIFAGVGKYRILRYKKRLAYEH